MELFLWGLIIGLAIGIATTWIYKDKAVKELNADKVKLQTDLDAAKKAAQGAIGKVKV